MSNHGNSNGVVENSSNVIKLEVIDGLVGGHDHDEDAKKYHVFPSSSGVHSPTLDSVVYSPPTQTGKSGRHNMTHVTQSASSNDVYNAAKLDFARKSQHSSLDLYSNSGSVDQSPSSSPLSPSENHQPDMFCSSTMSGDHGDCSSNTSIDASEAKLSDSSSKRVCLVCGDTASGFHYGVASCEACKAFFKRTIQGNIEYTCPASNDCEINKRRRKACQACRFQKCLRMGMLREGVRLDRVRGGRQKYRRTPESPYQVQTSCSPLAKKSSIEDNKLVAALLNCEPEPLVANSLALSCPSSSQHKTICILSDLVDRELVGTIGWAKQIPGFTDLILNDQMRLLQTTWAEILALSLAFRSHQLHLNSPSCSSAPNGLLTSHAAHKLVFANDFVMDDRMASLCKAEELYNHCNQLVKRLHCLKIVKEEYLVMKALILTNADIQFEDAPSVYKLRETLLFALQEGVSALRPLNSVHQLSQLLLCLPLIRQLDGVIRRYWLSIRRDGNVPMNKLFVEMLESSITLR